MGQGAVYNLSLIHIYIKELIQEEKQAQEQTAAEFGLLRGELNRQVTKITEVQESMTLKIAEVEKSVLIVEESMSTKISDIEETMLNLSLIHI